MRMGVFTVLILAMDRDHSHAGRCVGEGAITWLAVVILRCCSQLNKVLDEIEGSDLLGQVNEKALERLKEEYPDTSVAVDPGPVSDTGYNVNDPAEFGFFLPHGLGEEKSHDEIMGNIGATIERFDKIERVARNFFGIVDT